MSKIKLNITVLALLLVGICSIGRAQQFEIHPVYYTIFDQDSLSGFNENEARAIAIHERFLGSEFKIKMYRMKREYINKKYNLSSGKTSYQNTYFSDPVQLGAKNLVPGCVNEDFEASTAGVITTTNQIAGWSVLEGYNGFVSSSSAASLVAAFPNGLNGATSCNLLGCCPLAPTHSELIDCSAPGGYIDNTIGAQYPIFSVFGTGTVAGAAASNTEITQGLFGNKIIRLNDDNTGDYSMAKLSKTFSVTSQNALFQFAFISVFAPGHGCCDAGGMQIKLFDNGPSGTGTPTTITCPNFSVSAPSSACTATVPMTYYEVGTGNPYNGTSFNNIYNRWKVSSMDLSIYIGKYITIEVIVSDCNAGGHFGYVYFDAQCGPMTVYGNGNPYDAGANVTVPTCGAAGATICAADGLGPYSWAGIGLTPDQGVPSMTNQCITTTISSTYTLYMQPLGACVPITRVVQSSITPAPLLLISAQQAQCGSTLAVVNVTPSGSAANPSSLIWNPTPISLNSSTTSGQYQIPQGNVPYLVTVQAKDPLGCKVVASVSVNPAPPIPNFTITNVTNSSSITCTTPSVDLSAVTNYTYGSLNYFWASANSTFSSTSINVTQPGNFTVTATDPVTNCGIVNMISVGVNTVAPTSNANPMIQTINCNQVGTNNVTVTATSSTINITHIITSPQGAVFTSHSATDLYGIGGPGTYTYCLRNDENGCVSCKDLTVTSNDAFPEFQLQSPQSFTLGCNTKSVATINIVGGQAGGGGVATFTVINPGTLMGTLPGTLSPTTAWPTSIAGTHTVVAKDNVNGCETKALISVIANTASPNRSIEFDRYILNCYEPQVVLHGKSLTPDVDFHWNFPFAPGTLQGADLTVNSLTATSSNSVVGNFTINVTDKSSTCASNSVMTVYQNLYKPVANIASSSSVITCKIPTVTLNNQSQTTIPASSIFATGQPISAQKWEGPSPQEPRTYTTTYVGAIVGVYTITAEDRNNGCVSTATYEVKDGKIAPALTPVDSVLSCGKTFGVVKVNLQNFAANDVDYLWRTPEGVATPSIGNNTMQSYSVTQTGSYIVRVTHKVNGCFNTTTVTLKNDSLTADFEMDKVQGYAPLTVNFSNKSKSVGNAAVATTSISSIWNFGNGEYLKQKSDSFNINPSRVFKQPGTYTVTLYVNKGECQEKMVKIIKVDIPSSLTIPNVFTPNGDNVNDVYFIKTANLSNISLSIVDRWGHLVYELKTEKGEVAWDGKNQYGKDCAEGAYFFILKAEGADGKSYDEKGTINLYR